MHPESVHQAPALRTEAEPAYEGQGIPPGWRLVPLEATDEMISAVEDRDDHLWSTAAVYSVLINAAPPAPLANGEPLIEISCAEAWMLPDGTKLYMRKT